MERVLKNRDVTELIEAIVKLKSVDEGRRFFRDLCTVSELQAMAERWQVVRQVKRGVPYRTIADKTGASTATVTRVAHWFHHGMGGYELALDRMK